MVLAVKKIAAAMSAASLVLTAPVFAPVFAPAFAHDNLEEAFAECTCVTSHSAPADPLGRVARASGNVFATTTSGYQNASVGMPLNEGNEVTTGASGTARIVVGKSCRLNIAPSSQVTVALPAGPTHNICVTVNDLGPAALPDNIRVGIAIKALVGFGLTGVILSGGDDPASN